MARTVRITWTRQTRPAWSAFYHGVLGTVQVPGQSHEITNWTYPDRGRIQIGHLVVDGQLDFRVKPGETLEIPDPLDPGTWRVALG